MSGVIKAGDPWMQSYIYQIRQENKNKLKFCYVCKKDAVGITAKSHEILPVCKKHGAK